MRLTGITAVAHPRGNRIDLAWTGPPAGMGVRVMRREGGHPAGPDDGTLVAEGVGLAAATDRDLRAETIHYYTLFPYAGDPRTYEPDPRNLAAATALAPYDFGGLMFRMLPALYHRYDALRLPTPGTAEPGDEDKGQLRRFLDLPGGELDRMYSLARTLLDVTDLDRVDGALLPLLAEWIGWRTDFGLPVAAQRNEIRFAPRVYQTIGGLGALGATVTRVTRWPSRTKEYVHNVARTNVPERLNLWSLARAEDGTPGEASLASVNFAYDGRPVLVDPGDGSLLAVYHTHRRHGWDIWAKRHTVAGGWEPSAPVVTRPGIDKHPSAARAGDRLWLFWQSLDASEPARGDEDRSGGAQPHWRISFATRDGGGWSQPRIFGDPAVERQLPAAAGDDAGVWLFWQEGARVRYNRHDGDDWQLAEPATVPDEQVGEDPYVLVAGGRLWLFRTRHESAGPPGQTRRTIAYRVKQGLDPAAADWSPVRTVPKSEDGDYHDRYPYARAVSGGVELLWSTTAGGGPTLVAATVDPATNTWSPPRTVAGGPYANRGLAVSGLPGGGSLVLYRSNRSVAHGVTLDNRYAGTATVDARWTQKLALRGTFEDFQTYLHDARAGRRGTANRIARDTVGVFLEPAVTDPDEIRAAMARLAGALPDFLPATTRTVLITP
ncbi:hypothetical protein GA0070624_5134 [Micromonospora rhizosphaerae]|uniref:Phage tail protein domain-containing protein n=1 Tax=Micromonospora rhizosphaerae TaxID=568872 RepID=A0A1C6SZL8_9ACTN|nr:hypothetical protein [Micromonospora rhizosphaerae]SCL34980.1 hypothetical protein GA0070624_5134 [Micromonospora rhizosphaerae]